MIRAYVVAACLLGLGTAAAAEPQAQRLPVRVGVVFGKGTCRVLQLPGPALKAGTPVQVVRVVGDAQSVIQAHVLRVRSCLDGHGGPVDGHRVTLDLGEAELPPGEMAIGVVDPPRPIEVVEGRAGVDLDGDGVVERFRGCAASEGVHLTIWSGEPLQGPRRWHAYHYLGQDLEPTCTPADWGGPAAAAEAKKAGAGD